MYLDSGEDIILLRIFYNDDIIRIVLDNCIHFSGVEQNMQLKVLFARFYNNKILKKIKFNFILYYFFNFLHKKLNFFRYICTNQIY